MKTKFSLVSIVGRPNAGKSTLLNYIIGQKLSIVTPKVQTTRGIIRGIYTHDNLQTVFLDTPGIFNPKKKLERSMVRTAWSGLEEGVDFCFHLYDSTKKISSADRDIAKVIKTRKFRAIAVINKIDITKEDKLLPLAKEIFELGVYEELFFISSVKGNGINEIKSFLEKNSNLSPWMYDEDEVTTAPAKFLASEITREKLFFQLGEELPYQLTVETENWDEKKDSITINQIIYVTKSNYKKIIIGRRGQMLKEIGMMARQSISKCFDKKIHLYLFVKVRENWMDNPEIYNYMGMINP